MYVLSLRKLTNPNGPPDIIARSTHASRVWGFVELHTVRPFVRQLDGRAVMCIFGQGSELADYAAPNPAREDEGVLFIGTFDERVDKMLAALRPQIEQQVREAEAIMNEGTVEV